MANNRLYITNNLSNESFMLAKSTGYGWQVCNCGDFAERFQEYLDSFIDTSSIGTNNKPTCYFIHTENQIGGDDD